MSLTCSKCTYEAPTYYRLQQHIQKEHNNIVYKCEECTKIFLCKLGLDKHKRTGCKSKSLNPLECKYCFQIFNNRSTKCRHLKVCPCKTEEADVESVEELPEEPDVTTVVFEPRISKCTPFVTTHITNEDMKSIIFDYYNDKKKNRHLIVFLEYAKQIWKYPDNRCVVKPNIKLSSSKVHCGNNEWERYKDEDVIEKLRIDIAKHFMKHLENIEDETRYTLTKRINTLRGDLEFLTDDVFEDEHSTIIKETKYVEDRIMNFVLAR